MNEKNKLLKQTNRQKDGRLFKNSHCVAIINPMRFTVVDCVILPYPQKAGLLEKLPILDVLENGFKNPFK